MKSFLIDVLEPVAAGDSPLVQIQQLAEITSQPQTQTHPPCCLVIFENESGEKAGRTVLETLS